ncbi:hypothetical protein [Halopseudomonas sp.]|uniref:hypothetical protein n=1 Tax=Halopseudomonas sp. TaxID=2901191 RepID=UPI00311D4692
MSDTMLNAVIRMPYDMAMASELSRLQFYDRAQSLLDARAADKARIAELEIKINRLKRELTNQNHALRQRNIALDALHYVWCSGGCQTGMHRFDGGSLTEGVLLQAESAVKRMRTWFDNKRCRDSNHEQRMAALAQQGKENES